jgi:hypothetical protein
MSLEHVWLQMCDGGLVRADRISEIVVRPTPAVSGGTPRWLVDVVVPTPAGAGDRHGWRTGSLHRTLAQSPVEPREAPLDLARLLAQLDPLDTAGVVTTRVDAPAGSRADRDPGRDAGAAPVRFLFSSFRAAAPADARDASTGADERDPADPRQETPSRREAPGSGAVRAAAGAH